jgi:uncharacterized Rossmann fold enzyme
MRDRKIVIRNVGGVLVTVARTAPIEKTIIVRMIGNNIETIGELKQKASDLLGTTPDVPRVNDVVPIYPPL